MPGSGQRAAVAFVALIGAALAGCGQAPEAAASGMRAITPSGGGGHAPPAAVDELLLSEHQLHAIRVDHAVLHRFALERTAVGSIDFDEDRTVAVFSPYPGRVVRTHAQLGDEVARGALLYTIESPDLVQAESTLIAAAGTAELTTAALSRAKALFDQAGMAQKDYQQAVSDQMAADGALKAARAAVRVFGKSDAQIEAIIAGRVIDPELEVHSPTNGRVTARAAQVGLLVQPGSVPAPYSVADLSRMWLIASVPETDVSVLRVGQAMSVRVTALPGLRLQAHIRAIGASVDPGTHNVLVRSEVSDPQHALRSGMIATFTITIGAPMEAVAIPVNGVVREGDGTLTVWVAQDTHTFLRRSVRIGLQQDGFNEVLEGVAEGESVVTDGAILLSNLRDGGGADD